MVIGTKKLFVILVKVNYMIDPFIVNVAKHEGKQIDLYSYCQIKFVSMI